LRRAREKFLLIYLNRVCSTKLSRNC